MPSIRFVNTMLFCLFFLFHAEAQTEKTRKISGQVTESPSGVPLHNVHITSIGPEFYGTVSNADGSFILFVPDKVQQLKFSHLGYLTDTVRLSPGQDSLMIRLEQETYRFNAITVKPRDPNEIVRRVIYSIPQNYPQNSFGSEGFYRELIRDSLDYLSIAETTFSRATFPQVKSSDKVQLRIKQGRASEEVKATRLFEDFHPSGGPQFLAGLDLSVHRPSFLQEDLLDSYEYKIEDLTSYDGRPVYIIGFDQRPGIKMSLNRGKMYIDTATTAVIRYTSSLSPRGLPYIKHLTGTDKLMARLLKIEYIRKAFTVDAHYQLIDNKWFLHYGELHWTVQYRQPKKELDLEFEVDSEILITRILPDAPTPFPKKEQWDRRQLVINMPTDYQETYWGENNRIEPSNSVEDIIRDMQPDRENSPQITDSLHRQWLFQDGYSFKAYTEGEQIMLRPLTRSRWKNDERGPFMYQEIDGDFALEARVQVSSTTTRLQPPGNGFQQGGIMIRSSDTTGVEHYLFVSIGTVGNPKIKVAENATGNSKSAIKVRNAPQNPIDLKITRTGPNLQVFTKTPAETAWQEAGKYDKLLLGTSVQAGLAAFAHFNGNGPKMRPDLLVGFSRVQLTTSR